MQGTVYATWQLSAQQLRVRGEIGANGMWRIDHVITNSNGERFKTSVHNKTPCTWAELNQQHITPLLNELADELNDDIADAFFTIYLLRTVNKNSTKKRKKH